MIARPFACLLGFHLNGLSFGCDGGLVPPGIPGVQSVRVLCMEFFILNSFDALGTSGVIGIGSQLRARNALQAANGDPQAGFLDQPRIAAPVDMNVGHR